jgi:hypothetical protein
MTKTGLIFLFTALSAALVRAAEPAAPDLKEVTDLLRANLPGLTDAELNRAEVNGLLDQLHGRAVIVGDVAETNTPTTGALAKSGVLADDTIYLRVNRVGDGLSAQLASTFGQLTATNKSKGVVLDLRFADGGDYPAVASVAGLFLSKAEPLYELGGQTVSSEGNKGVIKLPLAVLVNRQTRGAAEVLAGVLRETRVALILGGHTGGGAAVMHDFPLKEGGRLRIAATPVQYANGAEFSPGGLEPDIAVDVDPVAEKTYYKDAYASLPEPGQTTNSDGTVTNAPEKRISEADLVKARKAGADVPEEDLEEAAQPTVEPQSPVLRDPALARAVDLVKGLAIVRQARGD